MTSEILFEKFQIIEVLKKDEHAGVYLANHIYLSKKIILKVLNTQKIHDPSLVERFKREAKILAKLDHPNIIKVYDFGMSNEFFYISFEYIEGESLRSVLKTKTLSLEQKEHMMIQTLKGLDYAHKNQIIHRDIKPENIFVDKNLNAKLGDFGLALSAEDNFVTSPYAIVGTPSYMSPEQVRGAKLTAQSDLFSLGVVLLELFTGKNPFLKENVTLTLNEINSFNEESLKEKLAEAPEKYREIFTKLLKKNINQRYNSAEEIFKELNIQIDQPTIIINNINRERTQSKLVWLLALAIVLIVAGIIFYPKTKDEKQNITPNMVQNPTQNNEQTNRKEPAVKQNDLSKDQVDLIKTNQPLINNQQGQQEQNVNQQNTNAVTGVGKLLIRTLPTNTEIIIDGDSYGKKPFDRAQPFEAGYHKIAFIHSNYPDYDKKVYVEAGKVTEVLVNMETETMGFINCWVLPAVGDIYINGNFATQLPMKINDFLKVRPGTPRIEIKNPRYNKNIDTIITIKAKDTLRLKFRFLNK
jgi:eukaryotic-like serine/threonine-protein kinase